MDSELVIVRSAVAYSAAQIRKPSTYEEFKKCSELHDASAALLALYRDHMASRDEANAAALAQHVLGALPRKVLFAVAHEYEDNGVTIYTLIAVFSSLDLALRVMVNSGGLYGRDSTVIHELYVDDTLSYPRVMYDVIEGTVVRYTRTRDDGYLYRFGGTLAQFREHRFLLCRERYDSDTLTTHFEFDHAFSHPRSSNTPNLDAKDLFGPYFWTVQDAQDRHARGEHFGYVLSNEPSLSMPAVK
jgi:hypothetical protein